VDMSKYTGSTFIKVDDLIHGPEQKQIIEIEEGRYDKPVVTFDDGSKVSLNGTNVGTLIRAFGRNDADWIGKKIELYAGTLTYNGNDNPAVLVRARDGAGCGQNAAQSKACDRRRRSILVGWQNRSVEHLRSSQPLPRATNMGDRHDGKADMGRRISV
jgi:hypothetical protein